MPFVRGANTFLRQQLDVCAESLRMADVEAARLRALAEQAAERVRVLEAKLAKEKLRTQELTRSVDSLREERDRLSAGWRSIRKDL